MSPVGGMAAPDQLREIYRLQARVCPGRDRKLRLADTALALGLPGLGSFSDLTHEQARTVIERLEQKVKP